MIPKNGFRSLLIAAVPLLATGGTVFAQSQSGDRVPTDYIAPSNEQIGCLRDAAHDPKKAKECGILSLGDFPLQDLPGEPYRFSLDFLYDRAPPTPYFRCIPGEGTFWRWRGLLLTCGAGDAIYVYVVEEDPASLTAAIVYDWPQEKPRSGPVFHDYQMWPPNHPAGNCQDTFPVRLDVATGRLAAQRSTIYIFDKRVFGTRELSTFRGLPCEYDWCRGPSVMGPPESDVPDELEKCR